MYSGNSSPAPHGGSYSRADSPSSAYYGAPIGGAARHALTPGHNASGSSFGTPARGQQYQQQQHQQQQHYVHQSGARVLLQVNYLTSFTHSASNTLLHVYQCAEPQRVAVGVPPRRVLLVADERGYDMDLEPLLKRCSHHSTIIEVMLLPRDAQGLTAVHNGDGTTTHPPLTDLDVLLQQSSQLDFIRTVGALYRPVMSGGTPPVVELDEGQPLAARVNCHRRTSPLRTAIIDGISREALRSLTDDHARQIRAIQSQLQGSKATHTTELVDMYAERDALRSEISRLQAELQNAQRAVREERDAQRLQAAEARDEIRRAREEVTVQKLLRYNAAGGTGAAPDQSAYASGGGSPYRGMQATGGTEGNASSNGNASYQQQHDPAMAALHKLHHDLESGEQFLARVRSGGSAQTPRGAAPADASGLQPSPPRHTGYDSTYEPSQRSASGQQPQMRSSSGTSAAGSHFFQL